MRSQLSVVKGGGLARACNAGQLVTLLISDVLGDPLESIASGPTYPTNATAGDALSILRDLHLTDDASIAGVVKYLTNQAKNPRPKQVEARPSGAATRSTHYILGNNATAVDAAGIEAERLGYSHAMIAAQKSEGPAEEVGRHLAQMALRMRDEPGPDCLISGGEPTVTLVNEQLRGQGGRNQQLALAALPVLGDCRKIAFLSAGTDGEDGPTNAAGALVNETVAQAASESGLDVGEHLSNNDAYTFFQKSRGLFITGPTHTNVCDLRVIAVQRD